MELLFDLDGTLTDPARGITESIRHALISVGRNSPPVELLRRYIGPPLRDTFVELLGREDGLAIEAAICHFRERFGAVGIYENEVYPDVPHGLAVLRERGHRLWVATYRNRRSSPVVFWSTSN